MFGQDVGRKWLAAAWLSCVLLASGAASAQDAVPDFYKEPGLYPNRDYVNQHVTENVDPFTGSLQVHSTDVYLPGNGGFDLKVVRSFNSSRINPLNPADPSTSSLAGMGWTVHFGRVLKNGNTNICLNTDGVGSGDNPVIELPDGSRQVLAFTGLTSPLLLSTQRWRADCLNGESLSVYSPDGVRYDMTQLVAEVGAPRLIYAWYATRITDRNGNYATINYAASASPQISSVTTSDGRTVTFSYLGSGTNARRISTIIASGRTWTYGYQAVSGVLDRYYLTSVTRPDTPSTSWQYAYNGVVGSDNANNYQLFRITYPQGGSITYGYGHVFFDTLSNPYSRSAVVTSKSTSDSGTWTFAYTPGGASVYDTTTVSTPSGTITYRHVGANYTTSGSVWRIGLLVQKSTGSAQTENYTWGSQKISDEDNRRQGAFSSRVDAEFYAPVLTQRSIIRDGVTYTTSFSNHDTYGNPGTITETGPNGGSRTTNLTYYVNTSLWIVNKVNAETTVGVGTVTRTWDTKGNLLSETRDGVATSYTYYATGDIQIITRPRGLISNYASYFRGIPQEEGHPEGVLISRVVSDAGNATSETNGERHTTTFVYDGLNRVTRITPPLGNATVISYTATSKTATRGSLQHVTTLDGFARPTNETTGGQARAFRYDVLGRRTFESIVGYPTVGHSFTYDILNRVTRITHSADASYRSFTYSATSGIPTLAVRDERNFVTTHRYRAYGDPDRPLVMSITAPVTAADVSMTRNGRGLVTGVTQAGLTRQFNYDTRYYLTSTVHPEVGTTTYGRDAAGNMTSKQVGASGASTYVYDGRNRLTRVTYPNGSPSQVTNVYFRTDKLYSTSNAVATRRYEYNANQNLTIEVLEIDGLTLAATYNYNANDQLASIVYPVRNRTVQFNPNALGRPTSVTVPAGAMLNATFWPNGQIASVAYTGGSRLAYGQNTREWLNSVTVTTGGDNVNRIASTLTYDVAGNVTAVNDSVDASYNRSFAYDAINRLTTASGPWGTGSVSYNGAGNILTQALGPVTRTHAYDTQNRLATLTINSGTGSSTSTSFGYDVYGNASPSGDAYAFNNASQITSTASGRQFSYDGAGVRVRTIHAGVTTYEFRSAHGLLLAEWRKQSGYFDTLKEHIHLAGKAVAEQSTAFQGSTVQAPTWLFLQPDASGSPISATAASGSLVFKENYQPYGAQINATAPTYTGRAFAGHKQDKSDLIYMGGRYYHPLVGRFLSIDPKEADPSDLHSLNRYAYANNNPNRFVDPDGYSAFDLVFFAIDAARLAAAIYKGGDVAGASMDLAMSAVGVLSPTIGGGQVLKSLRAADAVVDGVKSADNAVDAARAGALGTAVAAKETVTVQRWMSKAELKATQETGLLRGGRDGTHYVTDAANSDPLRARQRLALDRTPEVRATLEVPSRALSRSSRVNPKYNMPGGGMERTATGNVPTRVIGVD